MTTDPSRPKDPPEWEQFEETVARFLGALDETARVSHDIAIPDLHTGRSRQRDVWIEAKLLGLFPVRVLVSCKRWKRKLNAQHMDAFLGELASSGAQVGVIYSYSGYTKGAIEKAQAKGVACCRLFAGRAPDLPDSLVIPSFCFKSQVRIAYLGGLPAGETGVTWGEIFDIEFAGDMEPRTVLDAIVIAFEDLETQAAGASDPKVPYPVPLAAELTYPPSGGLGEPLRLTVGVHWACYRGDVTAYLVHGSYSETSDEFLGSRSFPIIDLKGLDPGPGWIRAPYPPPVADSYAHCILSGGDVREALETNLRVKEIG